MQSSRIEREQVGRRLARLGNWLNEHHVNPLTFLGVGDDLAGCDSCKAMTQSFAIDTSCSRMASSALRVSRAKQLRAALPAPCAPQRGGIKVGCDVIAIKLREGVTCPCRPGNATCDVLQDGVGGSCLDAWPVGARFRVKRAAYSSSTVH
jgi:hypothetical protein